MSFVVWLVAASGWDTGTGTYAGDGFDETGFSRALVADDDDARKVQIDLRAAVVCEDGVKTSWESGTYPSARSAETN